MVCFSLLWAYKHLQHCHCCDAAAPDGAPTAGAPAGFLSLDLDLGRPFGAIAAAGTLLPWCFVNTFRAFSTSVCWCSCGLRSTCLKMLRCLRCLVCQRGDVGVALLWRGTTTRTKDELTFASGLGNFFKGPLDNSLTSVFRLQLESIHLVTR